MPGKGRGNAKSVKSPGGNAPKGRGGGRVRVTLRNAKGQYAGSR